MKLRSVLADYYELSKPRIIYLLLITTAAAMAMAAHGLPPIGIALWTLLGGALSAASAGAFNCVYDADIDGIMRRTVNRPIPQGRISRRAGAIYATIAGLLGFAILYVLVNPLAAWLSLAGNVYYVFVYTMWLKRLTPLNIVIGGAAGAVPPLVGWAAVTDSIGGPALGLFALIFSVDATTFLVAVAHDRARLRPCQGSDVPQRVRPAANQARDLLLQRDLSDRLAVAVSAACDGCAVFCRRGSIGRRSFCSMPCGRGAKPMERWPRAACFDFRCYTSR